MGSATISEGAVLSDTYELREKLGQGGMGEVWRAQHLRLPRAVALKILSGPAKLDDALMLRFEREAEIASKLLHPNIVEVFDFNKLPDGRPFLVMELLEGEDLRHRLRRGNPDLKEAMEILRQVASALQVAHQARVVHRDLKPENIFICRPTQSLGSVERRVKVLDFGVSKILGALTSLTQDKQMLGTPRYMSPEQTRGNRAEVDGRADIFALATIAYEIFSGEVAFAGDTVAEVVYKVVYEQPPPLAEVAPQLPERIPLAVERALNKDPSRRFPTAAAFFAALSGEVLVEPAEVEANAGTVTLADGPAARSRRAESADANAHDPGVGAVTVDERPNKSGEVQPAASSAAAVKRSDSPPAGPDRGGAEQPRRAHRLAALTAIAIGGLCAGLLYWVVVSDPSPDQTAASSERSPDAAKTPVPSAGAKAPAVDAKIRSDERGRSDGLDGGRVAGDSGSARRRRRTSVHHRRRDEALPARARAFLEQARAALSAKEYRHALHLARRSLLSKQSWQAHGIRARAHCALHDLGMVRAALRSVPRRRWPSVRRYCARIGFPLE